RSSITGETMLIELSDISHQDTIDRCYEALRHMRLEGPIMTLQRESQLLTPHECKNYADDFLYDKQQCQLYFAERLWKNFDLQDAALFLSYLHVFPTLSFYSALPFLFELALRGDKWCDSFYSLVSRLRNDARHIDVELWRKLNLEAVWSVVKVLEILHIKAEKFEKYEDATVINRAITLWKVTAQQMFEST